MILLAPITGEELMVSNNFIDYLINIYNIQLLNLNNNMKNSFKIITYNI